MVPAFVSLFHSSNIELFNTYKDEFHEVSTLEEIFGGNEIENKNHYYPKEIKELTSETIKHENCGIKSDL